MLNLRHQRCFFLLIGLYSLTTLVAPAYAELPAPRLWVADTTHDASRESKQIALRFHSTLKEFLKKNVRIEVEDGKVSKQDGLDDQVRRAESYKYDGLNAFKEKKYEEALKLFSAALKAYQVGISSVSEFSAQ